MNGAQWVVHALRAQGVNTVFGYPGGAILNIYDELYKQSDKIHHVLTSHEQGASHAADGYARATGKVGVCMAIGYARATGKTGVCIATSGPGATNLITGLADALLDSIPVVAITGQVSAPFIGTDAFQEVDILGLSLACTKHSFLVQSLEELPRIMAEAFDVASSGRPGPVLVDIPKDIQLASGDLEPWFTTVENEVTFPHAEVEQARQMLAKAQKPMLYVGGGVGMAQAVSALREFLAATKMPATCTLKGLGAVEADYPYYLGMLGMHGCCTSNRAVAECDVLIAVGTRFSDRVALNPKTFAKNATIIQIDIDASELGKNVDVDLAIVGDAAYVLNAMLPMIEDKKHPDWMKMIHEWQAQDYHPVSRLMPHQVIGEVCNQCGPDAVYVTDVGQHQMWAAQYLRHAKSRGFITSGGLGTMGFGYGAAIGAQMALGRDQRVVMFTGDGSFHMNLNEACTAVSYELPIITVIFNNQVLGMVRQWQTAFYGKRFSQTDPHRKTNFVKLAEGFGLKGYHCENLAQFQEAFADALKQKGPTWIECMIDKDEKVLPMIPGGGDINDIIMK